MLTQNREIPIMICFPLYPPLELLHSFGFNPVIPWMLEVPPRSFSNADKHLELFTCGVARILGEFLLNKKYEMKSVVGLMVYNACDSLRNMPELIEIGRQMNNQTSIPFIKYHIPGTNLLGNFAKDYMRNEINYIIQKIEEIYDKKFSVDVFQESVGLYNKYRQLINNIEANIEDGTIKFSNFVKKLKEINFLDIKSKLISLQEFIQVKATNSNNKKPNHRILITGIVPPPEEILVEFERLGLMIVSNDIASIGRFNSSIIKEYSTPEEYYVEYYKNHHPCTTLHHTADMRIEFLMKKVKNLKIDGIIFIGEKFCEYEYFEIPFLKQKCKENDIPLLDLEFSIDAGDNYEGYITRIQAFEELLKNQVIL